MSAIKHHVEGTRLLGYCGMTGYGHHKVSLWNQYGSPYGEVMCGNCDFSKRHECRNQEESPCCHLILEQEHFTFDCSAYTYSDQEGLTSGKRKYATGTLVFLKVDGKLLWGSVEPDEQV